MGRSAKIRHRRLRRLRQRREQATALLAQIRSGFVKASGKSTGWTKAEREKLLRHCRSALRKQYGPNANVTLEGDTLVSNIPVVMERPADYIRFTFKV